MNKQFKKMVTTIVVVWLSSLMVSCASFATPPVVVIKAITSSTYPTKQELLGREVSPNAEIQIPSGFQLPEKNKKSKIKALNRALRMARE